jgi:hypothetical protein
MGKPRGERRKFERFFRALRAESVAKVVKNVARVKMGCFA